MKKHVYEVLKEINDADDAKRKELIKKYGSEHPYNLLLSLNFDRTLILDLPEGPPPYKRDEVTHADLFTTSLNNNIKKISLLFKGAPGGSQLTKSKKEQMFIQLLEAIPPGEADVLIFCKDKALTELYPNITRELVAEIFPSYCRE